MIRESVKELAKRGHEITIEEWDNLTLNTYERNYLYEFLPNEVILKICKQYNKHTSCEKHISIYNETVVATLFPELIRRMEGLQTDSPTFKLRKAINKFLKESSWNYYNDRVTSIEMLGPAINHTVCCGTIPFEELEEAIK